MQSFSGFVSRCNTRKNLRVSIKINGAVWSGSEMLCDSVGVGVKRPKTNAEPTKCFEIFERRTNFGRRQNNDRCVGKKPISVGLH